MTNKRGELRHIKRAIWDISGLGVNITKPVICLAVLGLLWGCAASNWEKSGITERQNRLDISECTRYSQKNYTNVKFGEKRSPSEIRKSLYDECMEKKGYKQEVQNKAMR